jgi:hypothetical protein
LQPSLTAVAATHDELAAKFRRLAGAAIEVTASTAARLSLATFVRKNIMPRLDTESMVLFPAFDSIIGGGYAVPANLFELDGIAFLVQEVERTAAYGAEFGARVYALSHALEGYFTKTELLVLPVLKDRLSAGQLQAVITDLTERNTP